MQCIHFNNKTFYILRNNFIEFQRTDSAIKFTFDAKSKERPMKFLQANINHCKESVR